MEAEQVECLAYEGLEELVDVAMGNLLRANCFRRGQSTSPSEAANVIKVLSNN